MPRMTLPGWAAAAAADVVVALHAAFVVFVVLGGLAALRWPRTALLHVPAAAWGAAVEFAGWTCPLTPLEVALRHAAGEAGYAEGYLAQYLWPLLYPVGLTQEVQWLLGAAVVVVNIAVYGWVIRSRVRPVTRRAPRPPA